jgi:hypothetical protein
VQGLRQRLQVQRRNRGVGDDGDLGQVELRQDQLGSGEKCAPMWMA